MPNCYTYILRCEGNHLYTGSTKDISRRFAQHLAGEGANFTKKHKPLEIVYLEVFDRIDHAYYREKQIQRWSRVKKEALIERHFEELSRLAECMNESHCENNEIDVEAHLDSARCAFRSRSSGEGGSSGVESHLF